MVEDASIRCLQMDPQGRPTADPPPFMLITPVQQLRAVIQPTARRLVVASIVAPPALRAVTDASLMIERRSRRNAEPFSVR